MANITFTAKETAAPEPTPETAQTAAPNPAPEVKKPEPKEEVKAKEIPVDDSAFEDNSAPKQDSEFDISEINDYKESVAKGDAEVSGWDKFGLCVPLSDAEKTISHADQINTGLGSDATEALSDVSSDLNTVMEASRAITSASLLLKEALERVAHIDKLKDNQTGHGFTKANLGKHYQDIDSKVVSGDEALRVFTTITGGLRKVTLWNSGFSINIKNMSLDALSSFLKEMHKSDYEYGKEYGGFYYLFADLSITEYIIDKLLPLVITGSNYADYKDISKLRKAISFQDYPVILWALASMMYPDGTNIRYVCSEPDCHHIESARIDLEKLRLNNEDLINEDMRTFMADHVKTKVTDEDLVKYRELCKLEKDVEFEYGDIEETKKKWKVTLKQCSLQEYMDLGNEFNEELISRASATSREEVAQFIAYNQMKTLLPWIKSMTLTTNVKGKAKTFTVENNELNKETINAMLDEFMMNKPEFSDMVKNYILDTKISHIVFYYPKCPKCGKAPYNSIGGFIPYDPMQNFFILGLTRLLRATSKRNS